MAYYRLKGVCSFFFDGSQTEEDNKKLLPGQIKNLEETARVISAKSNGAIEYISDSEYKELLASQTKEEVKTEKKTTEK